ncbi:LysR family transcriptional regulator [Patescibacteria group bacterium]|nr:LysR family transcriptional regulator [Patescibacteria group bacterium]
MIKELQRFILVANEGNLTEVAKKIFITQSALTQSMDRLEKEIGAKLFIQKGKYLELTADGKALASIGTKILDLWEKAKDPGIRKAIKPTITIGMYDNAALRLAKFVQENIPSKQTIFEFVIDSSEKLLSDLLLGVLDVTIAVINQRYSHPKEILCLKTFNEELIPVSNKIFNAPLNKIPFILFNKGSNTQEQVDAIFTRKSIKPAIYAQSTSTSFMKELAILGCGVALLPENFVHQELKQKILKKQQLPIKFKRQYGIFVQKNNYLEDKNKIIKEITKILGN